MDSCHCIMMFTMLNIVFCNHFMAILEWHFRVYIVSFMGCTSYYFSLLLVDVVCVVVLLIDVF